MDRSYSLSFWIFSLPFHGASIEEKPLGGTETALIYTARSLAALQARVTVYCRCDKPGLYDGVLYRDISSFEDSNDPVDVFIAIRDPIVLTTKVKARLKIFFSSDSYDQDFLKGIVRLVIDFNGKSQVVPLFPLCDHHRFFEILFVVGHWQKRTFVERLKIPGEKIFVTGNGYNPDYLPDYLPFEKRRKNLVYSSTPFRGLEILLGIFPKIREKIPGIELDIFSGMSLYGVTDEEDRNLYGWLYERAEQDGVVLHGPVRQRELAAFEAESLIFAYPNIFAETFCIAVLEAQAAGMAIVTTELAGLTERIENGVDGILVPGIARSLDYQRRFVDAIVELVEDRPRWAEFSLRSREKVRHVYTYDRIARSWLDFFDRQRVKSRPYDSLRLCSRDFSEKRMVTWRGTEKEEICLDPQSLIVLYHDDLRRKYLNRAIETFF